MSIKDFFENEKNIQSLSSLRRDKQFEGVEDQNPASGSTFAEAHAKDAERFFPFVDYGDPSNFAKYGLATEYYSASIGHIRSTYPYDGSHREKLEWHNSSSYLDNWMFENEYPKTTGYAKFSPSGWGSSAASSGAPHYIVLPSAKEYIYIKGGPHEGTTIARSVDGNVYDVKNDRETNFKADFDKGLTVEFWLKKDELVTTPTQASETIFDLWNGYERDSADSFRLNISIPNEGGTSSFRVSCIKGAQGATTGFNFASSDGEITNWTASQLNDSAWHHYAFEISNEGTALQLNFYVDGVFQQRITKASAAISSVDNATMVATIGAMIAHHPSIGAYGTIASPNHQGASKLSGSIDEFRFWKTSRNAKQIGRFFHSNVHGGTNTDDANTSLGVYYKFNESITLTSSIDSNVLDYSGRISNGTWVGYSDASRDLGSALKLAGYSEPGDPIIYSSRYSKDISDYREQKHITGSAHDHRNASALYNFFPQWIREEETDNSTFNFRNLIQIVAQYFDELYSQVEYLPKIKSVEYTTGSAGSKPVPFNKRLLTGHGLQIPNLFSDSSGLEEFVGQNQSGSFSDTLENVRNFVYNNIYNNLLHINKSKGTEQSARNMLHSMGLDEDLYKINIYADYGTLKFEDRYTVHPVKTKLINFNYSEDLDLKLNDFRNFDANVYQYVNPNVSNSRGYLLGSENYSTSSLGQTYELEVLFPKRDLLSDVASFYSYPHHTSSLFGVRAAAANEADLSWQTDDPANFQVYVSRPSGSVGLNSEWARFVVTSSGTSPFPTFESDFFRLYESTKWNVTCRLKPEKYPVAGPSVYGSTSSYPGGEGVGPSASYLWEFYAFETIGDHVNEKVYFSASIDHETAARFLNSNKRLYIGSDRQDFAGTVQSHSDVRVINTRVWNDYLEDEELIEHSKDVNNKGRHRPFENAVLLNTDLELPRIKTLALNWDFETVTGSDSSGRFYVDDTSYSPGNLWPTGWLVNTLSPHYSARGDFFMTSSATCIDSDYISSTVPKLPETLSSRDLVLTPSKDELLFERSSQPVSHYVSIEKSMYQSVSEDMLKMFSSLKALDNLIGDPVNRYRQNYKDLEKLRGVFFEKVDIDIDFERYLVFYKWFDSAVSKLLRTLVPASAKDIDKDGDFVESHVLERNKYWNKFPTLEMDTPAPIPPIRGINELLYPWARGSAPLSGDERDNCLWWKERAERDTLGVDPAIADEAINLAKKDILHIATTEISGTEPNNNAYDPKRISYDGTNKQQYQGSTYALRRLSKPYKHTTVQSPVIDGGQNYGKTNKNFNYHRSSIFFGEKKGITISEESLNSKFSDDAYEKLLRKCRDNNPAPEELRKEKVYFTADTDVKIDSTAEYQDAKSETLLPFSIYSASFGLEEEATGYKKYLDDYELSDFELNNLHADTYGPTLGGSPMQGPFTEAHVGGLQYRHVRLNHSGSDCGPYGPPTTSTSRAILKVVNHAQITNEQGPNCNSPYIQISDSSSKMISWSNQVCGTSSYMTLNTNVAPAPHGCDHMRQSPWNNCTSLSNYPCPSIPCDATLNVKFCSLSSLADNAAAALSLVSEFNTLFSQLESCSDGTSGIPGGSFEATIDPDNSDQIFITATHDCDISASDLSISLTYFDNGSITEIQDFTAITVATSCSPSPLDNEFCRPEGWTLLLDKQRGELPNAEYVNLEFTGGDLESWTNQGSASFTVVSGPTPSVNTGPSQGRSSASDEYLLADMSWPNYTLGYKNFSLESPAIDASDAYDHFTASFWYHMYGQDVGYLNFDVSDDSKTTWTTLKTISGQQQTSAADAWRKADVDLINYVDKNPLYFRFDYHGGTSFLGDIGIDDVVIEAWQSDSGSIKLLDPAHTDFNKMRAVYYRDETAKRPVNIRNIPNVEHSPVTLGNYSKRYEYFHTGGTRKQRRFLRDFGIDGYNLPQYILTGSLKETTNVHTMLNMSGTQEIGAQHTLPQSLSTSAGETNIVTRFSSPGGPEVQSRGYLDYVAGEFSPYNALPFKNRTILDGDGDLLPYIGSYNTGGKPWQPTSLRMRTPIMTNTHTGYESWGWSGQNIPMTTWQLKGLNDWHSVHVGRFGTLVVPKNTAGNTTYSTQETGYKDTPTGPTAGSAGYHKVNRNPQFRPFDCEYSVHTAAVHAYVTIVFSATVDTDGNNLVAGTTITITAASGHASSYTEGTHWSASGGTGAAAAASFATAVGSNPDSLYLATHNGAGTVTLTAINAGAGSTATVTESSDPGNVINIGTNSVGVDEVLNRTWTESCMRRQFDNMFVQRAIPRMDRSYAWITGSMADRTYLQSASFGHPTDTDPSAITFLTASEIGATQGLVGGPTYPYPPGGAYWFSHPRPGDYTYGVIPVDFVNLNTIIREPISENFLGWPHASGAAMFDYWGSALSPQYINRRYVKGYISGQHFPGEEDFGEPRVLNSILLNRQGPYGWPSWKQIRGGEHAIVRSHRRNNIYSLLTQPKIIKGGHFEVWATFGSTQQRVGEKWDYVNTTFGSVEFGPSMPIDSRGTQERATRNWFGIDDTTYSKITPVTSKYKPFVHVFDTFNDSGVNQRDVVMRYTYSNHFATFNNPSIEQFLTIKLSQNELYDHVKRFYLTNDFVVPSVNPINAMDKLIYEETIYPRHRYTYTAEARERTKYEVTFWREGRGNRTTTKNNSQGQSINQSRWALDAQIDFHTVEETDSVSVATNTAGELQNRYSQYHSSGSENCLDLSIDEQENRGLRVTPAAKYANFEAIEKDRQESEAFLVFPDVYFRQAPVPGRLNDASSLVDKGKIAFTGSVFPGHVTYVTHSAESHGVENTQGASPGFDFPGKTNHYTDYAYIPHGGDGWDASAGATVTWSDAGALGANQYASEVLRIDATSGSIGGASRYTALSGTAFHKQSDPTDQYDGYGATGAPMLHYLSGTYIEVSISNSDLVTPDFSNLIHGPIEDQANRPGQPADLDDIRRVFATPNGVAPTGTPGVITFRFPFVCGTGSYLEQSSLDWSAGTDDSDRNSSNARGRFWHPDKAYGTGTGARIGGVHPDYAWGTNLIPKNTETQPYYGTNAEHSMNSLNTKINGKPRWLSPTGAFGHFTTKVYTSGTMDYRTYGDTYAGPLHYIRSDYGPVGVWSNYGGNYWDVLDNPASTKAVAGLYPGAMPQVGETLTLVSTDGTTKTYIVAANGSGANPPSFELPASNTNWTGLLNNLQDAIHHADGHNGKITADVLYFFGIYSLQLRQDQGGANGNTTITSNWTNGSGVSGLTAIGFQGGAGGTWADLPERWEHRGYPLGMNTEKFEWKSTIRKSDTFNRPAPYFDKTDEYYQNTGWYTDTNLSASAFWRQRGSEAIAIDYVTAYGHTPTTADRVYAASGNISQVFDDLAENLCETINSRIGYFIKAEKVGTAQYPDFFGALIDNGKTHLATDKMIGLDPKYYTSDASEYYKKYVPSYLDGQGNTVYTASTGSVTADSPKHIAIKLTTQTKGIGEISGSWWTTHDSAGTALQHKSGYPASGSITNRIKIKVYSSAGPFENSSVISDAEKANFTLLRAVASTTTPVGKASTRSYYLNSRTAEAGTFYNGSDQELIGLKNEAFWDAGTQAQLSSSRELSGPFYDTYGEYAKDLRVVGKDYSIIPEFRISEHMPQYIDEASPKANFFDDVSAFLQLTGAHFNNSDDSRFFNVYSTSDFLEHFQTVDDDHKDVATPSKITLKCKALMKFLPYEGFYPAERTVQLAQLFSQSYGPVLQLTGTQANVRTALQPFFAPGIMYNTIKSGIGCGYPYFMDNTHGVENVGKSYDTDGTLNPYYFGGNPHTNTKIAVKPGGGLHSGGTGSFSIQDSGSWKSLSDTMRANVIYHIPFEHILNPEHSLKLNKFTDDQVYAWTKLNSTASLKNGEPSELYSLAAHNFFAESIDFFLKDGKLTQFTAEPDLVSAGVQVPMGASTPDGRKWYFGPASQGKTYAMDVILKNSNINSLWDFHTDAHQPVLTAGTGHRLFDEFYWMPTVPKISIGQASGMRTYSDFLYCYLHYSSSAFNSGEHPNTFDSLFSLGTTFTRQCETPTGDNTWRYNNPIVNAHKPGHPVIDISHESILKKLKEESPAPYVAKLGSQTYVVPTAPSKDYSKHTVMYDSPSGFGPLTVMQTGSFASKFFGRDSTGGAKTEAVIRATGTLWSVNVEGQAMEYPGTQANNMMARRISDWYSGYHPYTPSYYNGYSRARIEFKPDRVGSYDLEEIQQSCSVEYFRFVDSAIASTPYRSGLFGSGSEMGFGFPWSYGLVATNPNPVGASAGATDQRALRLANKQFLGSKMVRYGDGSGDGTGNAGDQLALFTIAPLSLGKSGMNTETLGQSGVIDEHALYNTYMSGTNIIPHLWDVTASFANSETAPEYPKGYYWTKTQQNAQQINDHVNLFGVAKSKKALYNNEGQVIGYEDDPDTPVKWTISTKYETPIFNFIDASPSVSSSVLYNPLTSVDLTPRGIWHQYGRPLKTNEGIVLEIQDIPEDEIISSIGPYRQHIRDQVLSLADVFGFDKASKRIGQVQAQKEIYEAVVAIPFVYEETPPEEGIGVQSSPAGSTKFYTFPRLTFDMARGESAAKMGDPKFAQWEPTDSIIDQVNKMSRYVFPPKFDFLTNRQLEPFAMFIFEFKHTLNHQEIGDIWQNLPPESLMKIKPHAESTATVENEILAGAMFDKPYNVMDPKHKYSPKTRWLVFKVKQKARKNYFTKTIDSQDDEKFEIRSIGYGQKEAAKTFEPAYSYNWPYDYFSMVELVKINQSIQFQTGSVPSTQGEELS